LNTRTLLQYRVTHPFEKALRSRGRFAKPGVSSRQPSRQKGEPTVVVERRDHFAIGGRWRGLWRSPSAQPESPMATFCVMWPVHGIWPPLFGVEVVQDSIARFLPDRGRLLVGIARCGTADRCDTARRCRHLIRAFLLPARSFSTDAENPC
jgi:hypothetical protein